MVPVCLLEWKIPIWSNSSFGTIEPPRVEYMIFSFFADRSLACFVDCGDIFAIYEIELSKYVPIKYLLLQTCFKINNFEQFDNIYAKIELFVK